MTYTFSNSVDEAVEQLLCLERFLDPITTRRIAELGLHNGARCWEIGAGAGSIAAWLATHVGPTGHVYATDINTDQLGHLETLGNVTIVQHDVTEIESPLDGEPYDLIHARLVLLHLPQREQILKALATHLAPGGALLLEEFDCTAPLRVYASRSTADTELFTRVTGAIIEILVANGADMAWAHAVHPALRAAGLVDVHTVTHSESWTGGRTGARLHAANSRQLAARLDALGITPGELDRFRAVVADPGHAAASYLFVSTRGRRPPSTMESAAGEQPDQGGVDVEVLGLAAAGHDDVRAA
jgi:2-polyprenyl-3-methyl-5-hydroxy-6-metoxy-1,4-benzoquinol methylase